MFTKLLNPIYQHYIHWLDRYHGHLRKQRSERDLKRLSDHLLDDIGMRRVNDDIVPIKSTQCEVQVQRRRHQKRFRPRHPYLIRHRQ